MMNEMTTEEAKRILLDIADQMPSDVCAEWIDAICLVIQALEAQPSEDCISRESLRQKLQEHHDFFVNAYGSFEDMTFKEKARVDEIDNCIAMVVNEPSVTPQQKMGRWVEENINEWSRKVFCSECGCLPPFEHISNGDVYSASGYGVINKTKFCPNCGAKMEKGNADEK